MNDLLNLNDRNDVFNRRDQFSFAPPAFLLTYCFLLI